MIDLFTERTGVTPQ